MTHTASRVATRPASKSVKTSTKSSSRANDKESPPLKRDRLIALLLAKDGVSIGDIGAQLGWLPHTVRAALSGLRKAGRDVERITAQGKPSRYRIKVDIKGTT